MTYQSTSRAAWRDFLDEGHSHTLDAMILAYLAWSSGATCEEIETGIGRSHQSVSGNLRHLVERGEAEKTEAVRKNARGRNCIVWTKARPKPQAPTTAYQQMPLFTERAA